MDELLPVKISISELFNEAAIAESRNALLEWMRIRIAEMIANDFDSLVRLLYRVDVNEKVLREKIRDEKLDSAAVIAELLLNRQEEKIKLREQFRQPPPEDPAEAW